MRQLHPPELKENIDLDTISDLAEWMSHPSSWVRSELFVIVWKGAVPHLSLNQAWMMDPSCADRRSLVEVAFLERRRRKTRIVEPEKEVTE